MVAIIKFSFGSSFFSRVVEAETYVAAVECVLMYLTSEESSFFSSKTNSVCFLVDVVALMSSVSLSSWASECSVSLRL